MKKPKPGLFAGILTMLVFAVCLTVPALMLDGGRRSPRAGGEPVTHGGPQSSPSACSSIHCTTKVSSAAPL